MTENRADRIRAKIAGWDRVIPETQAEVAMLRKIAADLLAKANKLDDTLAYQIKSRDEDRLYLNEETNRNKEQVS